MTDKSGIRILIIDDHEIFLAGLRLMLEAEPGLAVIGEARTRNEALQALRYLPDIILLDLDLGAESGTDLLPDLLKIDGSHRVLVLTGVANPELHLRAVCLGAIGIVHKLDAPRLLFKAIRKVHAGEAWLNPTMVASAMVQLQGHKPRNIDPEADKISSLTAREREVIALIGEGQRNKAIGERLYISEKTVRHYLSSIFNKLQVADRLELIIYAFQHGLAKLPNSEHASAEPPARIVNFR